jgi:hypothetical protein
MFLAGLVPEEPDAVFVNERQPGLEHGEPMHGLGVAVFAEGETARCAASAQGRRRARRCAGLRHLGVTYAIASVLANGEPQSTWVTTGVTVARWLRKAILSR